MWSGWRHRPGALPGSGGGGGSEQVGGERDSPDFQNLHRNKRSLTLDLKSEEGRSVFYRLAAGADVVVENMRPPVKERLGVDYPTLSRFNPRLVYGSISGFGQDGPYAARGGVDQIAQGLGGLMSVTGLPGQGPLRVGVPIADLAAGVYLAVGILAALHERERSGEGRWVQTSLLEAMVAMLDFQAARWTVAGEVPGQEGNHHPTGIPMGCFPTADGYMNIAGPSGRLWRNFCQVIGAPGAAGGPPLRQRPPALREPGRAQRDDRGVAAPAHDGRVGRGTHRGGCARRPGQHDRRGLRRPPGVPPRPGAAGAPPTPGRPVDHPQRPHDDRHRAPDGPGPRP